ncbi:MAG: N-6 DNA methylase [Leptolyngbyaceae cyanobacterium HOT.MB2.61]|nr:N-6 DNA methylase [Leptolyngbyaceae cyanobacterium HOT.MB2.61]
MVSTAYGLFTARVFSYTIDERRNTLNPTPSPTLAEGRRRETDFNREDAWELLLETNPFLRRLFRDVSKAVGEYARSTAKGTATALRSEKSDESPVIADELIDAIAEVVSILRAAKMDAILEDFRAKMNCEDIVIRFYEDFLAAYKPQMRERRGVYYTPEPVVSYMVRSVDVLLKKKFNKPLGLADPEVMILDPACGTGTFLLWIFQLIYQRFQENPDALTEGLEDCSWSGYVKERLLPRIFGFELLMAPYAICHLKLGSFLEETGYRFDSGKRLRVYLTNTLDEALQKSESLFEEFIAEESDQAAAIKRDKPIMIVLGNPPYSVNSANKSEWITQLVRDAYYPKDEMKEQNPKMLLDDYVKFIRFGQWRIDQTQQGILALITNYGYLDNPTFRGMRRSLEQSFNQIYVIDLHGNTKKKEVTPDGSKDENVFDIQQGVSVCLLLKK